MNFEKNDIKTNNRLKLPYLCVLYIVIFSSNFLSAQIAAAIFLLLILIVLTFGDNRISKNYLKKEDEIECNFNLIKSWKTTK